MRSRPDLNVLLNPPEPTPGGRLTVEVQLHVYSETPCDGIDLILVGRESRLARAGQGNAGSVYHQRQILRLEETWGGELLRPGPWKREVNVELPSDAPPTYSSLFAKVAYEVDVCVRIPWWLNAREAFPLIVRPQASDPGPASPRLFTSAKSDNRGEEPVIELSLENDRVAVGSSLRGAIALVGLSDRKLRRIDISIGVVEEALVKSSAGPTVVDRRTWTVYQGTPIEGEAMRFRIPVPQDLAPAMQTPFIRVSHVIEAKAIVAFERDIDLSAPIHVDLPAAHRRPPGVTDLPLIGRQRQLAVWRSAVERLSGVEVIDVDPEGATATLELQGIRLTVTEEPREGLGPYLVASLGWSALGLGLRVVDRRPTDIGGRVGERDRAFQGRFFVELRDASQAGHVLDDDVREALLAFDVVTLDDAGAVVLRKGGVHQLAGLERFLALAQSLAAAMARVIAKVPPPAALASALPAYRSFAAEQGARLRVGDLSLHGWSYRGLSLSLEHRWHEAQPIESHLWAPRPERGEPGTWITALTKATGGTALVEEARVGLALPVVTDPETVMPAADAIAKVLGPTHIGPYR